MSWFNAEASTRSGWEKYPGAHSPLKDVGGENLNPKNRPFIRFNERDKLVVNDP